MHSIRNGNPSPLRWSVLIGLAMCLPHIAASVCLATLGRGLNPYWFYGPAFGLTLVLLALVLRAMIRWSRLVRRHDGRLCIRCMYPLASLDAPGTCPECGEPFPIDAHRSAWHRILPLPASPPASADSVVARTSEALRPVASVRQAENDDARPVPPDPTGRSSG